MPENREILLALVLKHQANWNAVYKAIQAKENLQLSEEEIACAKNYVGSYITILDKEYPAYLKVNTFKPPFVLFYKGDINLLSSKTKRICVATSRDSDIRTRQFLDMLLDNDKELDYVVNETNTPNINRAKHKTICVLPNGLGQNQNLDFDLVITEYPNNYPKTKDSCIERMRISASLANSILVGETKKYSGINLLITQALQNGKEVMVMPASPWLSEKKGLVNNELIYEGAIPIGSMEHFMLTIEG